jgi:hypothetical protein
MALNVFMKSKPQGMVVLWFSMKKKQKNETRGVWPQALPTLFLKKIKFNQR